MSNYVYAIELIPMYTIAVNDVSTTADRQTAAVLSFDHFCIRTLKVLRF